MEEKLPQIFCGCWRILILESTSCWSGFE
jgi:hypothetical protein